MNNSKLRFVASLVAVGALGVWGGHTLRAETVGFKRVELQRHDLDHPGYEAVMARGEINPGATAPRHTHPGEEMAYVLEGQVVVEIDGKPPATLHAGDVFFVSPGTVHSAKNVGSEPAKILSTYIIEKGKPLATPAK